MEENEFEVPDDKEQLSLVRGEGRYFGVQEPSDAPVCANCQRRGHKRAQCSVVVCHACGAVDDHYETQCPKTMVCSNCGEKGHFRNSCTQKRKLVYCKDCDSRMHSIDRCPYIWRSYLVVKNANKRMIPFPSASIYCYNCAERGHYGDECPLPRTSKTPNIDGSAFSGYNLPKNLTDQYLDNMKRGSGKRRYHGNNYNYMPPPSYPTYNSISFYDDPKGNNKLPKGPSSKRSHTKTGSTKTGPTKTGFLPYKPQGNKRRKYN